ncbi:MAG: hypothetical protein G8345_15645 [Magnetococcales bacterium]|nr:hypothetical protein [Magnetococcales bacterium]
MNVWQLMAVVVWVACGTILSGCETPSGALPAPPQTTERQVTLPAWQVGDQWQYSDGYTLAVTKVEGPVTTFQRKDKPDNWFQRQGVFKLSSKNHRGNARREVYHSKDPNEIFPLKIGNKSLFVREYTVNGRLVVHQSSWSVDGRETIQVPAGKFDCWILVWQTQNTAGSWSGYEKWWYSPLVRHYVRMEYRYGDMQPMSRVLEKYELKK